MRAKIALFFILTILTTGCARRPTTNPRLIDSRPRAQLNIEPVSAETAAQAHKA